MGVKVFRSALTWRTTEDQDKVLAPVVPGWPDIPIYNGEDDLPSLLRPTTRKTSDSLYMASLAVLAKNEEDFKSRMKDLLKRNTQVMAVEDNWNGGKLNIAVKEWRTARRKDFGKHGGEKSAKKKKTQSEERAKGLTQDIWTDGSITNSQLVEMFGLSINTLKRIAHSKKWGHDRQKAIWMAETLKKRRDKRNAK